MKKHLAAALVLASLPFAASARDSLGGYNYIQGDVERIVVDTPNLGTDSFDFDGAGIRGSIELTDDLYVYGGYAWARNSDLPSNINARQSHLGLGYRHTLFDNADFTGELGFQHVELDSSAYRDNFDGVKASVGLRGAFGNNFEGWIKANYVNGSDYDSEFSGTVGGQFVVNETWGVVAEGEFGDLTSQYTVGVRASF
jgi:hypothetical protein